MEIIGNIFFGFLMISLDTLYDAGASPAKHKRETTGHINAYFEMF
jgi:hypothetical protein